MQHTIIETDVLVLGGGTAGCFAAYRLGAHPDLDVLVVDKAGIERSGCLAAGVNAINAYITKGRTPEFYADYAFADAAGIARYDLLISMSKLLNETAQALEAEGLVYLKDENGDYVERGTRNVQINGENIKPILARAARRQPNVRVLEHVNVTDLLVSEAPDGTDNVEGPEGARGTRVVGAVGFSVNEDIAYELRARAVLVATGGAAGLYRPNNPGFSRHKMWYPPFNTGAGYAMGIRAGAEMTSLEMRFIALRCKDTIAPTGTIAQGVRAKQVNATGDVYEDRYGITTSQRVWGTVEENRAGHGPCYLHTEGIGTQAEQDLYRAYLNMAPAQTLRWVEAGTGPDDHDVEIEGTEPYIVGGHTASGYWVDVDRRTTLPGLYAAGDVAGGAPQKYVTGALAEAQIAAAAIAADLATSDPGSQHGEIQTGVSERGGAACAGGKNHGNGSDTDRQATVDGTPLGDVGQDCPEEQISAQAASIIAGYEAHLSAAETPVDAEQLEEAMQKAMDQYAGGISTGYRYNEAQLAEAGRMIADLAQQVERLAARDSFDLLRVYELRERLEVCRALIAHLGARKETRWHSFAENADYPDVDPAFYKYVNSRLVDGEFEVVLRDIVTKETLAQGGGLEHFDR